MSAPLPAPTTRPILVLSAALLGLVACAAPRPAPPPGATVSVQNPVAQASATQTSGLSRAPSRLRATSGASRVASFATYYQVPDADTLTRLSRRDLSIVQPNISPDQMRALQTTGSAVAYLSIGELGTSNTYYVDGQAVSGQSIYTQRVAEGWFVGKNGNFGSYLLDLSRPAVRAFVLDQGRALLGRGFDGLFLDTADDAEFFGNGVTTQEFTSGALTLYANRPDYPTIRRAYIETVKALRGVARGKLLIQNGGFDLLLDRQNAGDGTQGYLDAVMHEVALTKSNKPAGATDDLTWPADPANYESWETYYARIGGAQAAQDRAYRENRDALALDYFRSGGVVLQQDFALPQNTALQCLSYGFARDLMDRERQDGWLSAYSDASFGKLFDYVDTSPAVRAVPGCADYDKQTGADYDLTFAPPSLGAGPGRNTSTALKVAAVGGFSGTVNVSLGSLPAGITGTLDAQSVVPGPQAQVGLTLNVAGNVAAGTYIIPVRARSGRSSMRYDLRLTVYRTSGDSVWVAQAGTGSVLAYDSSAALTGTSAPSRTTGNGVLRQPYAVAVDGSGNTYVAENIGTPGGAGQGQVRRYGAFGLYVGGETGTIGGLDFPTALSLDAQNRLWVVQSGLNYTGSPEGTLRVSRFDPGSTVEAAGFAPAGLGYPSQIALHGNTLWLTTTYGLLLRYDVTEAPTLTSIYTLGSTLTAFGGISATGTSLWLSGSGGGVFRAARVDTAALPAGNAVFGVDASAAITQTLTTGLYDPAGLGQDALGNLWVVNKTGAAGLSGTDPADHGTLVRFAAASLAGAAPTPDLNLDLGSRYPVGLAVGKP